MTYQIVSGLIGLTVAGFILFLIRRDHLHVRHSLMWLPVALGVAVLGIFPTLSDAIARWLGVAYPPVLPLLVAVAFLLIKQLIGDIERSRNERKLERLVQRLAILEGRLNAETAKTVGREERVQDD